ncbi:HAMP domain-containing protein [Nonomuraea sp. NPDC049655]|uniref:HAMP domain-containing protein n=1 Tax=Nonomuraea sp. NPDC049655 TaxID=3364355 RepID=UPI00379F75D1
MRLPSHAGRTPGGHAPPGRAAALFGKLGIRARLTLTYGSMLFVGGTLLLTVGYLLRVFGYLVADRALRPVAKMTATARKLSESTLAHQRLDLQGPDDELKELADTFDSMLTRLNSAFNSQRRFVANASHQLSWPGANGSSRAASRWTSTTWR